jgi:hypothetical protein
MKLEDLEKVLTHPNIKLAPVVEKPGELNRNRLFTLNGKEYHIEWWCNISYLHIGREVIVPFDTVKQCGTWPIASKLNLQFYDAQDRVCCIITGLETHP